MKISILFIFLFLLAMPAKAEDSGTVLFWDDTTGEALYHCTLKAVQMKKDLEACNVKLEDIQNQLHYLQNQFNSCRNVFLIGIALYILSKLFHYWELRKS